jgi:predicted enzyme related to lactoylglutathione lyase
MKLGLILSALALILKRNDDQSVSLHKNNEGVKRMFQGLRTVIYGVDDIARAKEWYSTLLGIQPYFDEPFYVGFNVGGFELGLDPNAKPGSIGPTAYWGVEDIEATFTRLLSLGARAHTPVQDVGDDIRTAVVIDPFGNTLGMIKNPHFTLTA